jgi:hypothetical protein
MSQFMLLLHESPTFNASLSAEEMQRIIEQYNAWAGELAEAGKLVRGVKLADGPGRRVARSEQGGIIDVPYAEAKEIVGGYFLIEAADEAEATAVARRCPHLTNGWVEVRAVDLV